MNDMMTLLPDIKLRFNIEHPSFVECYAYGYECALAEINEEENPYRLGSKESEQWIDGWWAGFYGEKPLYDWSDEVDSQPVVSESMAANDHMYNEHMSGFLTLVLEITGMLAVSAAVGYQVIEMVA